MTNDQAIAIVLERRGTMYDPEVVDTFVRVHGSITPRMTPPPQLQEAVRQIGRSRAADTTRIPVGATVEGAELPGELLAVMSLSRIVSGGAAASDVGLLAWTHLQRVVPAASCVFFVASLRGDRIDARFASGQGAAALRTLSMGLGQRLSGWVAANRQAIVNSDARLDFGGEPELSGLGYCLAMPLVTGDTLTGVVTLYAADPFSDDHARIMQMMAPHLAEMLARTEKSGGAEAMATPVTAAGASSPGTSVPGGTPHPSGLRIVVAR